MSNNKTLLFIFTLIVLLLTISVVNATTDNISKNMDSNIIQTTSNPDVDIIEDVKSNDKINNKVIKTTSQTKKNNNIETTKKNKTIKKAQTHTITNQTINQYFNIENNYTLSDNVNEGDTLDIQGEISGLGNNFTMIIDKPVNIISSTQNSLIDLNTTAGSYFGDNPGSSFSIVTGADNTNVTGINLHNTQLWISAVNHVTLDNITAVVENQRVGSGVGQTSIRNGAEYITIKNSLISTTNNGGSSSFVLAAANYCTIDNCTIKAEGNVGNLFYLTTFNVNINITGKTINSYNNITNCRIIAPSKGSTISIPVVIVGSNNSFINNTINSNNGGISSQWGGGIAENQTFINNTLLGKASIAGKFPGSKYINNTIAGTFSLSNSTAINNVVGGTTTIAGKSNIITNNNLTNVTVSDKLSVDSIIANNNITGLILVSRGSAIIENNTINSLEPLALNVKTTGNIIRNNIITAGSKAGDDAIVIDKENNVYENNTPETGIVYNVTDDTYSQFFDMDGVILSNITDYSTLNLMGEFNNKIFIINNRKLTINGVDTLLNNATITVNNNALVSITNIQINTSKDNAIVIDTDKNRLNNINITHNSGFSTILVNGNLNLLNNTIINKTITQATSDVDVISITSSNNIIIGTKMNVSSNVSNIEVNAIAVRTNTNITNNQINSNNIIIEAPKATGIKLNGNINFTSLNSNTIKLNTTKDANGIILNGNSNNNTLSSNTINITSESNANGIVLVNATDNNLKETIQSNNINITADNITGILCDLKDNYASLVLQSNKIIADANMKVNGIITNAENVTLSNTVNVTSKINLEDNSAITITGKNIVFSSYTINAFNASALRIINSTNVLLNTQSCLSNSTNPIYLINTTDSQITRIDATTESNSTIELINSQRNNITKSTLIANKTYGGNAAIVEDASSSNNIFTENTPVIYVLNNQTYNQLFDKNGLLNITYQNGTQIYLKSDLNGVVIEINEYIPLINTGNFTLYNSTVKYSGDMKTGYSFNLNNINIVNVNKTAIILNITSSNEFDVLYSNINVTGNVPAFISYVGDLNQYRSTLFIMYSNISVSGENPILSNITGKSNETQSNFNMVYNNIILNGTNHTIFSQSDRGYEKITSCNITVMGKNIQMFNNNNSLLSFRQNNIIMTGDSVMLLNDTEYSATRGGEIRSNNITVIAKNPVLLITTQRNNSAYTISSNDINVAVNTTFNGRIPLIYALGASVTGNKINITDAQNNSILGNEAAVAKTVSSNTPASDFHVFINMTPENMKYNQDGSITIKFYGLYNQNVTGNITVVVDNKTYTKEGSEITINVHPKQMSIPVIVNFTNADGIYASVENYTENITVGYGSANIQISVDKKTYAGETIVITAIISDNGELIQSGKAVFKLNGVTLKDANGNAIRVRIVNGIATIEYTIPTNYSSKDYVLSVVFANENYNRTEVKETITLMPKNIFIQPTTIMYENGKLIIKADIKDALTNKVISSDIKTSIKVNGKTITNKMVVKNGQISMEYDIKFAQPQKTITLIAGPNYMYSTTRMNITISTINTPKTVKTNSTQQLNSQLIAKV